MLLQSFIAQNVWGASETITIKEINPTTFWVTTGANINKSHIQIQSESGNPATIFLFGDPNVPGSGLGIELVNLTGGSFFFDEPEPEATKNKVELLGFGHGNDKVFGRLSITSDISVPSGTVVNNPVKIGEDGGFSPGTVVPVNVMFIDKLHGPKDTPDRGSTAFLLVLAAFVMFSLEKMRRIIPDES